MKLRFHKKIYPKAAVNAAVQAFEGAATVTVERDGDYTVVDLTAEDGDDLAEVAGEFDNYVLGESIAMRGER